MLLLAVELLRTLPGTGGGGRSVRFVPLSTLIVPVGEVEVVLLAETEPL